jgi:hypothetical protein
MKKKTLRKLVLTTETLRSLDDRAIRVVGAGPTAPLLCFTDATQCSCASQCTCGNACYTQAPEC